MWALFTRALTAAPSTTKVSITNTSANFLVTAILGMIVFGEPVRGLWWLGAAMMAAGCILVGMRENQTDKHTNSSSSREGGEGQAEGETITLDGDDHDEEEEAAEDDALLGRRQGRSATKSGSS